MSAQFFPSRTMSIYMGRLFILRSAAVLAALVLVGMCRSARGLDQEADWPPEPALGRLTLRPPLPGSFAQRQMKDRALTGPVRHLWQRLAASRHGQIRTKLPRAGVSDRGAFRLPERLPLPFGRWFAPARRRTGHGGFRKRKGSRRRTPPACLG